MGKHRDFDAFFSEQQKSKITFTYNGEQYSVPGSPPLGIVVYMQRKMAEAGKNAELSEVEIERLAVGVMGADQFKKIMDSGCTIAEFETIFAWLMAQYNEKPEDAEVSDPGAEKNA